MNAHEDSILCLAKVTDSMFASGSSNGHFILWQSDTLIKIMDLRPCEEVISQNDPERRLGLTSITFFQCLYEVKVKIYIKLTNPTFKIIINNLKEIYFDLLRIPYCHI